MRRNKQGGVCFLSPDRTCRPRQEDDAGEATLEVLVGEDLMAEPEMEEDPECDREVRRTIYELFHADIRDIPLLSPDEEKELSRRILEEGDREAFDRFVLGNLRLVIACAKKVKDRMGSQSILSFMDMIQEGILGLMTAVGRFDYRRNTRFSTYGIPWIYQRIKMALLQHRFGMSIPGFASTSVYTMSKHIQAYRTGKMDDIPEDVDIERIRDLSHIVDVMIPIDYAEEGEQTGYSLSPERLGYDGSSLIADSSCRERWDEEIERVLFCEEVLDIIRKELTEQEFGILSRRFGIGQFNSPEKLSDIAEAFGKSQEHIRIVVGRAMKKLKLCGALEEVCSSWDS